MRKYRAKEELGSSAGRNNSCTTKENEKGVSIKPGHRILENTSVTFSIFHKRLLLQKWQRLITRPLPHESPKSKEGGKTRLPISRAKTFNEGGHINCL